MRRLPDTQRTCSGRLVLLCRPIVGCVDVRAGFFSQKRARLEKLAKRLPALVQDDARMEATRM